MTLLAPLFLLGLAALALPLWLHRRETASAKRIPFSSTLLLTPSQQPVHVRKRLRYWWLLALRLALLSLLALAFAQPVLLRQAAPTTDAETLQLIVIDRSASMGHDQRFQAAIGRARSLIQDAPAGDPVGIFAAADNLERVADFTESRSDVLTALARLEPRVGRTDLGAVMDRVAQTLEAQTTGAANAVVHIVSDFQSSGLPDRFSALVTRPGEPSGLTLQLHPVAESQAPNWAVTSIRREGSDVLVTIAGYGTTQAERAVQLRVNGRTSGQRRAVVTAGGQQTLRFDDVSLADGDNLMEVRLTPPDGLTEDDVRFAVFDNSPARSALVLRTSPDTRAATYISTALASGPRGYDVEIVPATSFDARILERFTWVAIDDLTRLDESLADRLRNWVNEGGRIFAALGPPGFASDVVPVTGHVIQDVPMRQAESGASGTNHSINAAVRGWDGVLVSHAYRITKAVGDLTIAALPGNVPLLIEHELGRGRALILASALDNRSNDLPVRRMFVGLIAQLARHLDEDERLGVERIAGDRLQLAERGTGAGQITGPDGRALLSLGDTQRSLAVPLQQTGFYEVHRMSGSESIAVNLDPRESVLEPMTPDALTRWERAFERSSGDDSPGQTNTLDDRLPLWEALLLLLVLAVLAESLVANRQLEAHA